MTSRAKHGPAAARRSAGLLAVLGTLLLAACVRPGAPQPTPPHLERPRGWTFQVAEHVALWYFGLAHTGPTISERGSAVLPRHDSANVRQARAAKRALGIAPTALERQADELGDAFDRSAARDALELLPLHFHDQSALVSALRVWTQVGGDPRRAGSQAAANVVALLSGMFPQPSHRQVLTTFSAALVEEQRVFYAAHWAELRPLLERAAELAQLEWNAHAAALRPLLSYVNLEGGEAFLVPALGAEGRMLARGAGRPRVALPAALPSPLPAAAERLAERDALAAAAAQSAVFGLLGELVHQLAVDAVREHVSPARTRELGLPMLEQHATVRGGAAVLAVVAPARAEAYQLHYLRAAGQRAPSGTAALQRAFEATFALPPELERGLREAVRAALAGI